MENLDLPAEFIIFAALIAINEHGKAYPFAYQHKT